MRRTAGLVSLVLLSTAALTSCALLPPYPSAAPRKDVWPEEKLTRSMDPWLLGDGFSDRIAIEVDWVEGCKPGPHTIEGLRSIAVKYAPPGVPVAVTLDDEIPRAEWDVAAKRGAFRIDPFVAKHADFASEPCDPEFRNAHFYVLFAPGTEKWLFGYSGNWFDESDEATVPVQGIAIFHGAHKRFAKLWFSCDRLEAMTVKHEYGHQLGLVANGTHERTGYAGGHCTELKCLMAQPTLRVYTRNAFGGMFNHFLADYCERCQEDIRRAQEAWRAHVKSVPDYREQRVQDRQVRYWLFSIGALMERGEHAAALEEVERARRRYPENEVLVSEEIRALIALERLDEAAALLERIDSENRISSTWALGRALNLAGRYEETIALFDRGKLRKMEEYDFEQTSFVLKDALESSGRLDEAIALIDEMLARGPATYYRPEQERAHRAELLCRAGRADQALSAVEKGLGSRKTRPLWYDTGAEVYRALERTADANALLEEWIARVRKHVAKAGEGDSSSRWYGSWTIAGIQARLGDGAGARASLAAAGDPPEGTDYDRILWTKVPVLARLGEWDRAADLIRKREPGSWYDVCGDRDLVPIHHDARYADLFSKCANLRPAAGP